MTGTGTHKGWTLVFVGLAAVGAYGVFMPRGEVAPARAKPAAVRATEPMDAELENSIAKAISSGVITHIDASLNTVHLKSLVWISADAQQKEALARNLARYCKMKGGVAERVTLYDAQSAKELGGISGFGSFYVK